MPKQLSKILIDLFRRDTILYPSLDNRLGRVFFLYQDAKFKHHDNISNSYLEEINFQNHEWGISETTIDYKGELRK